MADLLAKTATHGLVPVEAGGVTLDAVAPSAITSLAPFAGKARGLSKALKAHHGIDWPDPGQSHVAGEVRILWSGRAQAMLIGAAPNPALGAFAAMTDQTDAWCCLSLTGPGAREVLARLTPLDLRDSVFGVGQTGRTLMQHMSASLTRTGPDSYEILVMRSMAGTAVHDLSEAMKSVAAQSRQA